MPVDTEPFWGRAEAFDIDNEFRKKIQSFSPDLIAFSIIENNYGCARNLLKIAKQTKNIPILVGGIFPTVAPSFFINDESVDLICIGEGEHAIIEIANRMDHQGDLSDIPNLIIKTASGVLRNPLTKYYNWDPLIFQDWELFDQRHIFKPFMGQMHRMGFFELSRGCPYQCSYCANASMQYLFKGLGKYNREKPIKSLISEVSFMKDQYNLDSVSFNDENFLQMNRERLGEFCREFPVVNLPFDISARADNLLDEEVVKMLRDAGCISVGMGVEHGNELFRKTILNKHIPNHVFERAFSNCNRAGVRAVASLMIGLPFETEENIMETVNFCRKIKPTDVVVSIFAPYYGTRLRRICVENGLMEDRYHEDISWHQLTGSILSMPQLSRQRIGELYYSLHDLIYGEG